MDNKSWHEYVKEKEKYLNDGGERLFLADGYEPAYKDPKVKITVHTPTPANFITHKDANLKNINLSNWCIEHDGY